MGALFNWTKKNINLTCIEDNLDHIHDVKEASDAMQVTGPLVWAYIDIEAMATNTDMILCQCN